MIESKGFAPEVQTWLAHRPPAGRLARPIALVRDVLTEALKQRESHLS